MHPLTYLTLNRLQKVSDEKKNYGSIRTVTCLTLNRLQKADGKHTIKWLIFNEAVTDWQNCFVLCPTIRLCSLFKVRHVMGALIITSIERTKKGFQLSRVSNPGYLDHEPSALTVRPVTSLWSSKQKSFKCQWSNWKVKPWVWAS